METMVIVNLFAFLIVGVIGISKGLDLRRWSSWLYGIYGFLSGFLIGFLTGNASGDVTLGLLFGFAVMYSGAMVRLHRQRFE
jgi:4-hydroxybenzoate polyprenyltransferase